MIEAALSNPTLIIIIIINIYKKKKKKHFVRPYIRKKYSILYNDNMSLHAHTVSQKCAFFSPITWV